MAYMYYMYSSDGAVPEVEIMLLEFNALTSSIICSYVQSDGRSFTCPIESTQR